MTTTNERETFTHDTTTVRPFCSWDGHHPTSFEVHTPQGNGTVEVTSRGLWSYVEQTQRPQVVEGSRRHATLMRTWNAKAVPWDDQVTPAQLELGRHLIDAFRNHPLSATWIAAGRTTIVRKGREGLVRLREQLARERAYLDARDAALLEVEAKLELAAVDPTSDLIHVGDQFHEAVKHLENPRRYD